MHIILFIIAIAASAIGAITGIGGGIIIKPVVDSMGVYPISTINFLSGCTVLSMAMSSYIRSIKDKHRVNYKISLYLAGGSCIGGYLGKIIFSIINSNIAIIQAVLLLIVNIGVIVYVLNKNKLKTLNVNKPLICAVIGLILGTVSSFLGIGGGPINIAVLYYFFSMQSKEAARNSLFIILFSQISNLLTTIATKTVPEFNISALLLMCTGGVSGAIIGSSISKKLQNDKSERFFIYLLIALIIINIYNVVKVI